MHWNWQPAGQSSDAIRNVAPSLLLALLAACLAVGEAPAAGQAVGQAAAADRKAAAATVEKLYFPLALKRQSHRDALRRVALPDIGSCTVERFVWLGDQDADINDADVDGRGNLWLATTIGAVGWMADGRWLHVAQIDGLADDDARAVAIDHRGQPWFGTAFFDQTFFNGHSSLWWDGGLSCLVDPDANRLFFGTRTWRNTGDAASGVLGPVADLVADPRDGIWLATGTAYQDRSKVEGGIYHVDSDGHWTFFVDPGRPTGSVQSLAFDAEDSLWMEGENGIVVRRGDGSWPASLEGGRPLGSFSEMAVSAGGDAVWLAGNEGRTLFRRKGGAWLDVDLPSGLTVAPHTMAVDPPGNLWFASETYAGVRWKEGALQIFPRGEGLGAGYIERIWRDRIGDIWVNQWTKALGEGLTRLRCR